MTTEDYQRIIDYARELQGGGVAQTAAAKVIDGWEGPPVIDRAEKLVKMSAADFTDLWKRMKDAKVGEY